jgi:DNA replication protein DnaC
MTFENYETYGAPSLEMAKQTAMDLNEENGGVRWLTLVGKVDRGKTHLAIAICHRWMERGKAARYAFVPLLLKELRDGFELEGEQSYRMVFDRLCRVPLLVLDDLGVEKPSYWAQEQIQTIVHYRGINGLPLVVTSNKPLDSLEIDPDMRIASRLQRESWCRVIALEAREHRLRLL